MPWVQCWSLHLRKDVLELEKVPRGLIKCVGQLCMSNNVVGWNWKRDKQTVHNVLLVPAHAIAKGDQRKPVWSCRESCILCSKDNGVKVCDWNFSRLCGPLSFIWDLKKSEAAWNNTNSWFKLFGIFLSIFVTASGMAERVRLTGSFFLKQTDEGFVVFANWNTAYSFLFSWSVLCKWNACLWRRLNSKWSKSWEFQCRRCKLLSPVGKVEAIFQSLLWKLVQTRCLWWLLELKLACNADGR